MSAELAISLSCDRCGEEDTFPGRSKRAARQDAERRGWKTGVKPTTVQPSLYDVKVDICPYCVPVVQHYKTINGEDW